MEIEWKTYPEFSDYLFSNTGIIKKGEKIIKTHLNKYNREMCTLFDDTGKSRGFNASYAFEILFPKKAFKQYPNYSNYLIYEDGTILNKVSKIVMKVFAPKNIKRKRVRLINDQGEKLELDLAHIVAELFLENPNHIFILRNIFCKILNDLFIFFQSLSHITTKL
jgi:hypothetical protein